MKNEVMGCGLVFELSSFQHLLELSVVQSSHPELDSGAPVCCRAFLLVGDAESSSARVRGCKLKVKG